jgi:hypothetical protein
MKTKRKNIPLFTVRMPADERIEFIKFCESNGSNASDEVRDFIKRSMAAGKLETEVLASNTKAYA